MSKVICDICGTAYPETASQCPICGNAKQVDSKTVTDASAGAASAARTPTRGGHFSNANVRKRNRASQAAKRKSGAPTEHNGNDDNKRSLVIVAWILLVAVILVLAYIVVQFVVPMFGGNKPDTSTTTEPKSDVTSTEQIGTATPVETGIACTDIVVAGGDVMLDAVGRAWLLEVTAEPADTTDVVTFASSDESVATVDAQGRVTAVGPGTAVITINCGNVCKQCNVVCSFGDETTAPDVTVDVPTTEATQAETTAPSETTEPPATTEAPTETTPPTEEKFGLFRAEYYDDDTTLVAKGETFEFITRDGISLSDITWTSDNPAIATVENGKVTAVAPGKTVIRGTYNGESDSCTIRCAFEGATPETDNDSGDHPEWPHLYPSEDVSIGLDESFEISYVNADGELPDIDWYSDNGNIAVVDGDTVTGVGYGVTAIHGSYDGESITCIVRVLEIMD